MAVSKTSLPALSPDGNLSRYLEQIRSFPMLEQKQEYMLAKAWKDHGDVDAAHQMVTSHLRLVAKIAMGYRGYGLPVADLISEDNTRLTLDCLSIALGLRVYSGDSMTLIAKRYGVTRAAVSKRCVDIVERLKLPPSRAMRSETARRIYRNSRTKHHRSKKHGHPFHSRTKQR